MSMSIKNREKLISPEKKQEILAALAGQDINNCLAERKKVMA